MIIIEANGALDMLLIYNSLVCVGRGTYGSKSALGRIRAPRLKRRI
jgi:hypothetical protein